MSPWGVHQIPGLYHFTDTRNLPSIRASGGLYPLADLRRKKIEVPAPGGNDISRQLDAEKQLDEYVHLCFRTQHPMEYVIRNAGQIAQSIFLQIDPVVISWDGVCFASDIANKTGVRICPITEAAELIDFEVLYTRTDWRDPEIQQRLQRAARYEVLVPRLIPLESIRNLPDG